VGGETVSTVIFGFLLCVGGEVKYCRVRCSIVRSGTYLASLFVLIWASMQATTSMPGSTEFDSLPCSEA
jgi:hypothetical protein